MSASGSIVRRWEVGPYTVELVCESPTSVGIKHMTIEWLPSPPDKPLTGSQERAFRRGKREATASIAEEIGTLLDATQLRVIPFVHPTRPVDSQLH